uniref:Protein kinase domain-containing protein n=1 Tax=Ficedula albicollis TaxID=59894 RepID=A0A803W6L1_FICAL
PEVVKGELYGEKADVWVAGCILYQMATLNPSFYSSKMLSLATKIVGAVYEPVPGGLYSEKMFLFCMLPWYFMEANQNAVTQHHQLSILSQVSTCISLHSSSSGAASCKSEFSENTDLPVGSCQPAHRKDEERTYELLCFHFCVLFGIFSELDNEVDKVDNSSSSRSNNLKESAIGKSALLILLLSSVALAGIAASQRKVQQISDPVQQILIQLHKIIFITQVCIAVASDILYFLQMSMGYIFLGSPDPIEPNIFTADGHGVHLSSGGNMLLPDGRKGKQSIINFCSGIYISNKVYGAKAEGIATPRSVFKDNQTTLIFWRVCLFLLWVVS